MTKGEIDYPALVRRALQGVVREILRQVGEEGFPGEHHLYVTFRTTAPGVELPNWLRRRYPEEMNVVLQHQFWDLAVDDERFSVSLRFSGKAARMSVPFDAIEAFLDPAAEFGLKLNASSTDEQPSEAPAAAPVTPADGGTADRVVSLEAFRERSKV